MKKLLLFLSLLSLVACATAREPAPIPSVTPNDSQLGCSDIYQEYKVNTQTAATKISKNILTDEAAAERGCLIWPRLPDFKNADGIEGNALLVRNIRLRRLAELKDCDISHYPEQPENYK